MDKRFDGLFWLLLLCALIILAIIATHNVTEAKAVHGLYREGTRMTTHEACFNQCYHRCFFGLKNPEK